MSEKGDRPEGRKTGMMRMRWHARSLARLLACQCVLSTLAAGGLARSVDGRRGRTREFDDPRRRRRRHRRRHVPCYCTSAAAPVALVGFADSIIGPIVILSTQVCVFLFARIRFELATLSSGLYLEVKCSH